MSTLVVDDLSAAGAGAGVLVSAVTSVLAGGGSFFSGSAGGGVGSVFFGTSAVVGVVAGAASGFFSGAGGVDSSLGFVSVLAGSGLGSALGLEASGLGAGFGLGLEVVALVEVDDFFGVEVCAFGLGAGSGGGGGGGAGGASSLPRPTTLFTRSSQPFFLGASTDGAVSAADAIQQTPARAQISNRIVTWAGFIRDGWGARDVVLS